MHECINFDLTKLYYNFNFLQVNGFDGHTVFNERESVLYRYYRPPYTYTTVTVLTNPCFNKYEC